MEYTIKKLSQLAGISTRTLRYYDEIGILKPARINSSGYRIYGQGQIDNLQQILFYREMGLSLEDIQKIVTSPEFDKNEALKDHRKKLLQKRKQLDLLIANVDKTIADGKGRIKMTDKEKFEGFKANMIEENEKNYGKEIREKHGEETVKRSNQRLKNMTQEEYDTIKLLEEKVKQTLKEAINLGDPSNELAQEAVKLHKEWLCYYWDEYSKEAHVGIAQMYVDDERFKAYYDKIHPGMAEFLRDAILIYTGEK